MFFYVFAILSAFLIHFLWKYKYVFNTDFSKNFEKDAPFPLLKNGIPLALLNREQLFALPRKIARKYNQSVRGKLFHVNSFLIMRAKDVEKILGSTSKHLKKGFVYNFLHPFLKTGLLTSEGEKWHTRRRLLTPAFHFNILKEFSEIFKEEADQLVNDLKNTKGNAIDVVPISTQFTLNTVCESAMGVKLSNIGNNGLIYRNKIYEIGEALIYRSMRPWLYIDYINSMLGHKKKLDDLLTPVHNFTQTIVDQRRNDFITKQKNEQPQDEKTDENENIYMKSRKKRSAMLDTLLQAQSEGSIDNDGIIEETDTFTFEGHDTTSAGMTFTLLLLSHHSDVQEKLFEEIKSILNDKSEFNADDLNQMTYMERVLKESMRIYPPVPFIARTLTEDVNHEGVLLKKGTNIEIHIYDIHRDPDVFPMPEKFDPDRFLSENSIGRSNYAFIPFSAGMRNCIGQRFAMLELKIMLVKVVQNFKILPITKREDVTFISDLVLRTNHPIKMKFKERV